MSGPLQGVKVIELAGLGPAPYACMLLADMGADILRFERGDAAATRNESWDLLTRSRHSVAIDLKNPVGRDLILELCEQAEIFIEGFRPGVTERLGLGPNEVWQRNAQLVYGRMTGYGQTGVLSQNAGHDINYIAVSGALWPVGREGDRPVPPLNLVGDFGGGSLFLALGVVAALVHARASGEGQVVDAAMVDGSASLLSMTHSFLNAGFWREERGVNILDTGAHFYEVYETSDEKFVAVGAIEPKFYAELLEGLGLDAATLPGQMERDQWPELKERLASVFRSKTRDEWTAIFENTDACVTPVLSPSEAARHRYNVERQVYSIEGTVQPNPAPRFSKTPSTVTMAPQTPGSGTSEGLAGWGISEERRADLKAGGAFGQI